MTGKASQKQNRLSPHDIHFVQVTQMCMIKKKLFYNLLGPVILNDEKRDQNSDLFSTFHTSVAMLGVHQRIQGGSQEKY